MALELVTLDPNDATGAANTALIKAALLNSNTGIIFNAGTFNVKATTGGSVAPMPINKEIAGAYVEVGKPPITKLVLVGSTGTGGSIIDNASNGVTTGVTVRNLELDGGRTLGWSTTGGSCINFAGQNDYSGTPHNVLIENCIVRNGPAQNIALSSVNGATISHVKTGADTLPVVLSHGFDFDAVADEKPTKNVTVVDSDLDSYGQESFKLENVNNITFLRTYIRMYATITQDAIDPYADVSGIVLRRCTLDAHVSMSALKRRRIPGSTFVDIAPGVAVTLSGSNTVGGSLTSTGSFTFTASHVGQAIGWTSGSGQNGLATINSVSGGQITSSTVIIVFSSLSLPANANWMIAGTDNGGSGDVTYDQCTFTENGMIYAGGSTSAHYGTITITENTFNKNGNSYYLPSGTTIVASSNLFSGLPVKRFARPSSPAKYSTFLDAGTGFNAYMARWTCTTTINTAVTASANGEEVWVLNGKYTSGGGNRSINCAGKTIVLRAETPYGVLIDASGGSGWSGFAQTADVAGHLIWGFIVYGAGLGGGNGSGFTVTGGDSYLRQVAAIKGSTANAGAGIRISTTGTVVVEDYLIADCDGTTTGNGGALYVSQSSPIGTITLNRGRIINNIASTSTAGVRLDNANTTVNGMEVFGNVSTSGIGGISVTKAATIKNLTAANNIGGGTAHDISIANAITVTGDSWICWSDNATAIHAVNITSPSGVLNLDKATLYGGAAAVTGRPSYVGLTNISSSDPLFIDSTGKNFQLSPSSPARGTGVNMAGIFDAFNRPFLATDKGFWK